MITLKPCLIVSSGAPAVGKSTTLKGIAREVGNAFYLDRDDILMGLLHVAPTVTDELPPFEEYVKDDNVFPRCARDVNTPFGKMTQVDPKNAYNLRHGRDQSYLIQAEVAGRNLKLRKVPMLDCIVMRQIRDGTLHKFLEHPKFEGFEKYHLHFTADLPDIRTRMVERAKTDEASRIRDSEMLESDASFERIFGGKHNPMPEELSQYNHLVVNTSNYSQRQAVDVCLDYITAK